MIRIEGKGWPCIFLYRVRHEMTDGIDPFKAASSAMVVSWSEDEMEVMSGALAVDIGISVFFILGMGYISERISGFLGRRNSAITAGVPVVPAEAVQEPVKPPEEPDEPQK